MYVWHRYCNHGLHPLHGTNLRGSIFSVMPFIDFDVETKEIHSGVTMDLLKTLAKKFQFDFSVKLSTTWFEFWPDGSITGALGEVLV